MKPIARTLGAIAARAGIPTPDATDAIAAASFRDGPAQPPTRRGVPAAFGRARLR